MGILGVGGGIAYAIYVTLSTKFFIEIWLPPVAVVSVITLAVAFLKIHGLPFWEFLMHFIEYHLLAKKRHWIQGSGYPFVSPLEQPAKKKKKEVKVEKKETKNIHDLTKVLDSHGKDGTVTNSINQEK